jgi:calmodulin
MEHGEALVSVHDITAWLDEPKPQLNKEAAVPDDYASVMQAIGAGSLKEILSTFFISDQHSSQKMQDACILTRPAFDLMRADPVSAKEFYSICRNACKAYRKMRVQVSDGLISAAVADVQQPLLDVSIAICSLSMPQAYEVVCMKSKMLLENFCTQCSYALRAELNARLQFQIKVCAPRLRISHFSHIQPQIRDELQAALKFFQEDESGVRSSTGSMQDVQDAMLKQLEQLKYLDSESAIDHLTGDTADSMAVLKQAYRTFDIDGSGTISNSEVQMLLRGLGVSVSHESISDLFSRFDKNGDMSLDFMEFVAMMRSMKQV